MNKHHLFLRGKMSVIGVFELLLIFFTQPLFAATISFQNGVSPDSSYTGTEDTYINGRNATTQSTNYNAVTEVRVSGSPGMSGLLKWDIRAIPQNAVVTDVTMTVNVTGTTTQQYEIYEITRLWVVSEATWKNATSAKTWKISGASHVPLDHGSTVIGTMTAPTTGLKTFTLNAEGVAVVQNWVKDSAINRGIIIQNYTNTKNLIFNSSAHDTFTNRPKLTVTYTVPTSVSGSVYSDINHNGALDGAESGIAGVSVDLFDAGNNTLIATTVTAPDGTYSFTGVNDGNYDIRKGNPVGFVSTTPDILKITVAGANLSNQNFGDFPGAQISGVVFYDTGIGGGISHNGLQDGGEEGVVGVAVRVTDLADTIPYDQTFTGWGGAYALWIPASAGMTVVVRETNPSNALSITPDALFFTIPPGNNLPDNSFADVPPLFFAPNGSRPVQPGGVVTYAHTLTAGTAGPVELIATSSQTLVWTFYKDANGNAELDGGEPQLAPPDLDLTANQTVMILARAFIPSDLPIGVIDTTTITAKQTFVNSLLTDTRMVTDVTALADGNLQLTKTGSATIALPGETLEYTLTYKNISTQPLMSVVLYDTLSEYVNFVSAIPLPDAGFPDPTGLLQWTLPGTLNSGNEGSVFYTVTVK